MKLDIHSIDFDKVIKSRYVTASTDYKFANESLVPLISRLEIQRNIQDSKFYNRLEKDIVKGCIMPALTLAFIDPKGLDITESGEMKAYLLDNIQDGFILDGIQRLNTLSRTIKNQPNLDLTGILFLNIVICSSMDNLLYRMITLNNGQKPMSARHQIEILTTNVFEFENSDIPVFTEKKLKEHKIKIAFNKADFVKGYLAFLANSTNIENQKIIEDKLDELIADKILDSNVTEDGVEFVNVIDLINKFSEQADIYKWFRNINNLIGFCVGIKKNYINLSVIDVDSFSKGIKMFEVAFQSFNYSKIKVGRIRRNLVSYYVKNWDVLQDSDDLELIDTLSQVD
ncbi:hypothetical protein [Pedobacter hartonius]|uniref:DUF262 domain-containing protein n=1 Tax=Pedobacter hartonius TaxID=425514 RepID=A0A1H4DVJ5_9SPHI|nr:hypothetical protein [Pedobacter hartonius]SEA76617.1 hypothetical protein SAMN05443550_105119 [Pedobacter hartonius]